MSELHEQTPTGQKLVSDITTQLAEANKRGAAIFTGRPKGNSR